MLHIDNKKRAYFSTANGSSTKDNTYTEAQSAEQSTAHIESNIVSPKQYTLLYDVCDLRI